MDQHLNIFYPYSIKETDNIREDNITRASLICFSEFKNEEKISFINSLLGTNFLNTNENYSFDISLQPTSKIFLKSNKFLIGFCPNGHVRNCYTSEETINAIASSTIDHNARADGQISIFKDNDLFAVLIFENKFQDLFEDQLKRHYELLLGITSKEEIEKSLVLKTYNEFFNLYKRYDNRLSNDLLEFVNIAGYLRPTDFSDIEKIKYNRKMNIEFLLGKALDTICQKGQRDVQVGWGEIINIKDINDVIDMIGLIYNSDDTVQLCLKFGSRMRSAQTFYNMIDFKKIKLTKDFAGEFHVGYIDGYIKNSFIRIENTTNYLKFVNDNLSELKQTDLNGLKAYVTGMTKASKINFDSNNYCFSDKRLTHGHINIIPSLVYSYIWNVSDLYGKRFSTFTDEVKKKIDECISILGININY